MDPRTVIGDDPLSQNDEVSEHYLFNKYLDHFNYLKLVLFFRAYGNNIFVTMN